MEAKSFSALTTEDLRRHSVWRYKSEDRLAPGEDESWVEPVARIPVRDAWGHFFVAEAELADGTKEFVLIGNTEPRNPSYNRENQNFTFFRQGVQFHWTDDPLSQGKPERDPDALAKFLGKLRAGVFPFRYNISKLLEGSPEVLARSVSPSGAAGGPAVDPVQAAIEAAMRHFKNSKPGP